MIEVNPEYYQKWLALWSSQSKKALDHSAIVRVIECTNGCIQYAFRDGVSIALPLEKTRECMKFSMGIMKTKVIPFPDGTTLEIDKSIHGLMNKAREIYIKGFKQNDDDALDEFVALSKANFVVLGRPRIEESIEYVRKHFGDLLTPEYIDRGRDYIFSLIEGEVTEV